MTWFQREIQLPPRGQGIHPITREIVEALPELAGIEVGLVNVFIRHTSASLTINENADPDVPIDLDRVMASLADESFPYRHTIEGPDDMPAHVKASLLSSSVTIPISAGQLALGTWQGVFLCEHRREPHRRSLVLTIHGATTGEEE